MTLRANKAIWFTALAALVVSSMPAVQANPAMMHSPGQSMTPAYTFAAPNHFAPASSPGPIFGPTDPGIPVDTAHSSTAAGAAASAATVGSAVSGASVTNSVTPLHLLGAPDPGSGGAEYTAGANNNTLFAPNGSYSAGPNNFSHMHAVSAVQPMRAAPHSLAVAESVMMDKNSGCLLPGNYLIRPDHSLSLTTAFGIVQLAAQSCVLLVVTPASINIYDLYDRHAGSVVWSRFGHRLKLLPGWIVTVSGDSRLPMQQINPCCSIFSHSMQTQTLPNGERISSGKFSIASALVQLAPLRHDELVMKAAAIQSMRGSP